MALGGKVPVLKWAVIGLVTIAAVVVVVKEGRDLWKEAASVIRDAECKKPENQEALVRPRSAFGLATSLTKEEVEVVNKVIALGDTVPHAVNVDVKEFLLKPDKTQIALVLNVTNRHDEPIRLGDVFYAGYRMLNNKVYTVHPTYPERLISYDGIIFKTPENPVIMPGVSLQYTVYLVYPPIGMVDEIEKDGGLNAATLYFFSPSAKRLRAYIDAPLK